VIFPCLSGTFFAFWVRNDRAAMQIVFHILLGVVFQVVKIPTTGNFKYLKKVHSPQASFLVHTVFQHNEKALQL
jgi:hypothetical protein